MAAIASEGGGGQCVECLEGPPARICILLPFHSQQASNSWQAGAKNLAKAFLPSISGHEPRRFAPFSPINNRLSALDRYTRGKGVPLVASGTRCIPNASPGPWANDFNGISPRLTGGVYSALSEFQKIATSRIGCETFHQGWSRSYRFTRF